MNAIKNPFSPGAGSPPPEMVGREGILDQARILLGRIKEKRPEKSILLTGLRGVGKTVLLNEIDRRADKAVYRTVSVEAHEDKSLAALLVPPMRTLLFELDRIAGAGDKAKRGLAVLKGFMNAVKVKKGEIEVGLDIDPEKGAADSGDLESDLPNLFLAVAEAAEELTRHARQIKACLYLPAGWIAWWRGYLAQRLPHCRQSGTIAVGG
jgi:Cdc6-like AAA superfamily ATPase